MKLNEIDVTIGKSYPASVVLDKVKEKSNLEIQFGHILVEYETEKRHKYFINTDFIKTLKETPIKIYTIIPRPSSHNFALKLLENNEVREILESVEANHNLVCLIDENDLAKANCNAKSKKKAISLINSVFKSHRMTFRASSRAEGIQIRYMKIVEKKIKEEK